MGTEGVAGRSGARTRRRRDPRRRRAARRPSARWPRPSRTPSRRIDISSCKQAPAPGRRSPTSSPRSSPDDKTVVATATKALQDQLATKDLPFLERTLGRDFSWTILKGRSNYVCRQRVAEVQSGEGRAARSRRRRRARLAARRGAPTRRRGPSTPRPVIAPSSRGSRASPRGARSRVGWDECPGAAPVPEGRRVPRRGRPGEGRGGRRRRREHPPLRHAPRDARHVAARARPGRDRRGASARGSRLRDRRASHSHRAASGSSRARCARSSSTPSSSASLDDMADRWADAIGPTWASACLHPCPRISPDALALAAQPRGASAPRR